MKSILDFQNWTKKMSKNEKPKYFLENEKFVTIKNFYRLVTKNIAKIL
jgi:hypothetical protein